MLRRLTRKVPRLITQLEGSPAEQRLDQRAFRQRSVGTLGDYALEHPLHPLQIGDLRPHVLKVCGGDGARLATGLVALVDETQQLTDFIKGEAELARPQHKAKAPLMRRVVAAIAAGRTWRFGQKADLLVIAHGLQVAARPSGELSPLQALHHGVIAHRKILLDPVATTDRMVRHALDFGKKSEVGMVASRSGTADSAPATTVVAASEQGDAVRQRLAAVGGILGALAASSCCIVPLILFSLGIGGAWIGNLTALAPYKPLSIIGTAGVLGYGFYLVYWKPRRACADSTACARPITRRLVQLALWLATVLVVAAFAFDYLAPLLLPT